MEQIRLIMLVESRIRGNVYVRFGGEFLKTSHSNMERRWELSLLSGSLQSVPSSLRLVQRLPLSMMVSMLRYLLPPVVVYSILLAL